MSTFIFSTSNGTLPMPCTASTWKSTPFSLVTSPSSAIGWTVPISLFASITETRMVLSVIASRSCCAEIRPNLSVGR